LHSPDIFFSTEEILIQFGYDSDSEIPEEDMLYLSSLIHEAHSEKDALNILSNISIISSEDLNKINEFRTLKELEQSDEITSVLKKLIRSIILIKKPGINGVIREKITVSNGVRHDLRSSMSYQNYRFSFLFEKDPNELNIFDHVVTNLQGKARSLQWIVGDFQLEGAYGLIAWRATPVYKGFETIKSISRRGKGLKPYRSSNEYWSTRGLGVQWSHYGTLILSLGNTFQDGQLLNGKININETGLHITKTSLIYQNKLREQSATLLWEKEFSSQQFGFILNNQNTTQVNKLAKSNFVASVFGSGKWKNLEWFGENAFQPDQSMAVFSGLKYRLDGMNYLVIYRSYPHGYSSFRSQPFSEWRRSQEGESGVFQNIYIKGKHYSISIFNDFAQKEKSLIPFGAISQENGFRWQWSDRRKQWLIQFRQTSKSTQTIHYSNEITPTKNNRITSKWQYQYKPSASSTIRWQIHTASDERKKLNGLGIETKVVLKGKYTVTTLSWIITYIQDHDGRLYFWGLNLPGEMSSIVVNQNSQQLATRIQVFKKDHYGIYMRYRIKWFSLKLKGTITKTAALAIQIKL